MNLLRQVIYRVLQEAVVSAPESFSPPRANTHDFLSPKPHRPANPHRRPRSRQAIRVLKVRRQETFKRADRSIVLLDQLR